MKKVLFIFQEKYYNNKYIIYMKFLKIIGYEIHVLTDIKDKIKYCDKKIKVTFNIFKIMKYVKSNSDYEMVFCNSKIIEILIKLISIKEKNKIIYINNKIIFQKQDKEKDNFDINVMKEKYIFCSVGDFNTSNNQIMQLESMIRIIEDFPQTKLLMIGQGKFKEYYEHVIEKYGLSKNVEIIENIDSKIDILRKVSCIISTRKKEEFALDSIIAIMLNKPIIASNVGINKFILKKENIFYNSDNLKEKMRKYIVENKCFEKYYNIKTEDIEEILKSESL